MDVELLLAVVALGLGGLVLVAATVDRARHREVPLAELLGLPTPPLDPRAPDPAGELGTVAAGSLHLANRALHRWDRRGTLRDRIEQADLALRPAELVVIAAAAGLAAGAALGVLTGVVWVVPLPLAAAPLVTRWFLTARARRRAARFAAQLPDALGLVAGSLAAGHTFLRSIQLMADEVEAPLADELRRVVDETQLGTPLVAALDAMAARVRLDDVAWMVRAIRIQQAAGGQLGDLLAKLSEHMRAREELRREVRALTAEGRVSAWVLGAMPVCLFVAVQVVNPGYLDPLLQGWGLVWSGLTAVSVGVGIWIILRMVETVDV